MSLRPEIRTSGFELRAFVVVVVAVSAVAATWIVANASRPPSESEHATLDVSAEAVRHVPPDRMTFTVTVRGATDVGAVAKLVRDAGVPDPELSIKPATVFDEGEATQDVEVTTTDLARGQRAYRAVATAALAGIDVTEPTCSLADPSIAEQEVLVAAQQRVRARAEAAARAYGAHLGRVTAATVGDVDLDSAGSCDAIVLTATAHASYELE